MTPDPSDQAEEGSGVQTILVPSCALVHTCTVAKEHQFLISVKCVDFRRHTKVARNQGISASGMSLQLEVIHYGVDAGIMRQHQLYDFTDIDTLPTH